MNNAPPPPAQNESVQQTGRSWRRISRAGEPLCRKVIASCSETDSLMQDVRMQSIISQWSACGRCRIESVASHCVRLKTAFLRIMPRLCNGHGWAVTADRVGCRPGEALEAAISNCAPTDVGVRICLAVYSSTWTRTKQQGFN